MFGDEKPGQVPQDDWLTGSRTGFRRPRGTTFPDDLRRWTTVLRSGNRWRPQGATLKFIRCEQQQLRITDRGGIRMYYFLELWTPGEGWRSLSETEQEAWVERAGEDIQGLLDEGVELVAIGRNDVEADRQTDHAYWAVWRMPSEELLEEFQDAVREAGVYELMEQGNLCGTAGPPPEVLGEMIGA